MSVSISKNYKQFNEMRKWVVKNLDKETQLFSIYDNLEKSLDAKSMQY